MSESSNSKQDLFMAVEKLVRRWLKNRQELIVHFCSFSRLPASLPPSYDDLANLETFCQKLMDYISIGHFEIYEKLLAESQAFGDKNQGVVETIYPKITQTTDKIVEFNSIFDRKNNLDAETIKQQLSRLGEILDQHFLLEDGLIRALHQSHETEATDLGATYA